MKFITALADIINLIMKLVGAINESIFKAKVETASKKAEDTKNTKDIEDLINR